MKGRAKDFPCCEIKSHLQIEEEVYLSALGILCSFVISNLLGKRKMVADTLAPERWGLYEDDKFIEYLERERIYAGPFVHDLRKLDVVLLKVRKRLSYHLKCIAPYHLVRTKFRDLRRNYHLFMSILTAKGVKYDRVTDKVHVPLDRRPRLMEVYPGSIRYFDTAPHRWKDLEFIFSAEEPYVQANQPIAGNPDRPIVLPDSSCKPPKCLHPQCREHRRPGGGEAQLAPRDKSPEADAEDRQSHVGPIDDLKAAAIRNGTTTRAGFLPAEYSNDESTGTSRQSRPVWG